MLFLGCGPASQTSLPGWSRCCRNGRRRCHPRWQGQALVGVQRMLLMGPCSTRQRTGLLACLKEQHEPIVAESAAAASGAAVQGVSLCWSAAGAGACLVRYLRHTVNSCNVAAWLQVSIAAAKLHARPGVCCTSDQQRMLSWQSEAEATIESLAFDPDSVSVLSGTQAMMQWCCSCYHSTLCHWWSSVAVTFVKLKLVQSLAAEQSATDMRRSWVVMMVKYAPAPSRAAQLAGQMGWVQCV